MELYIELGTQKDIAEMGELYNKVNDYLESGINYPGWKKDIYPNVETAIEGIQNKMLFVVKNEDKIVGSVILNHKPEKAYSQAEWEIDSSYSDIIVIHTLVVHPDYLKCGVGKKIMEFTKDYSKKNNMKSIRLDVVQNNAPAIGLYEKSGYKYIDTVDLGLGIPGLVWFRLYELVL